MAITIDQAQKILDLRVIMAQNIREGREAHHGLTPEDYSAVLEAIRGNRANAVAAGVEKAKAKAAGGGKKGKAKASDVLATPPAKPTDPKFNKFANFSFD
jgi:hypothetical protein